MDLDRDSLELMLNLLDADSDEGQSTSANGASQAMTEARSKTRELCRQLQKKGHAKHLDLDSLDVSTISLVISVTLIVISST